MGYIGNSVGGFQIWPIFSVLHEVYLLKLAKTCQKGEYEMCQSLDTVALVVQQLFNKV